MQIVGIYGSPRKGGNTDRMMDAFLEGALGFMDIPRLIEEVMGIHQVEPADSVERILSADGWAREKAREFVVERGCNRRAQAL